MSPHRLYLDEEGDTVCVAGHRIPLDRRPPLRRILHGLVAAQAEHRALSTAEVFACGWPGERVSRDCSANRVYVALATLRRLGLRGVIVRGPGGYLLDADVRRASCVGITPDPM